MNGKPHYLYTEDGKPLYTSVQVADSLGMTRNALMMFLHRHNDAVPARKVGFDWFWTEDEIEVIRQAKSTAKRGRPTK